MRKVYTFILAFLISGGASFAQRSVDWSVDEIIKPIEITSNTTTGSYFDAQVVLKNNGPDAVMVGDSVLYQVRVLSENDATIIAVPGATSVGLVTNSREFQKDDTMHFHLRFTLGSYFANSFNVKFWAYSFVVNRSADSIGAENTAEQANNILTKNIVWWNPQRFGVGIEDITNNIYMDLQPNPAADVLKVNYNIVNIKSPNRITIYDVQGRLVYEKTSAAGATFENVDVSALNAGMYTVNVKSGDIESHQKLQVLH
jgi:Secretion system C-terminal sorting domain